MRKINVATFLFYCLLASVVVIIGLLFVIADQSKQIAVLDKHNIRNEEILEHYGNMYNAIIELDDKLDWADKYDNDVFDTLFHEMTKVDSLYNTQL